MSATTRRNFLKTTAATGAALAAPWATVVQAVDRKADELRFGMVTYQWGKDWDVPTLITNLEKTKILAVELRTTHAHGVDLGLSAEKCQEVKQRFADSPVTLLGLGTAEEYHHTDPEKLKKAIQNTKDYVKLSQAIGGSGVKVRPNDLPKGVDPAKTIAQIARSLDEVAAFAAEHGQQIRLEVHGACAKISVYRQIMAAAKHPNACVCWNSNQLDLEDPGLEANFMALRPRFGATAHVRPLDTPKYPWPELIKLFVKTNFKGWLLLEAGTKVDDRIAAMNQQRELFEKYVAEAKKG